MTDREKQFSTSDPSQISQAAAWFAIFTNLVAAPLLGHHKLSQLPKPIEWTHLSITEAVMFSSAFSLSVLLGILSWIYRPQLDVTAEPASLSKEQLLESSNDSN